MILSHDTIRSGGAFAFFGKLIAGAFFALGVLAFAAAPADAQQRRQQPQQQKQAQQEPEETEIEQIALTQAQIDGFIQAQTEMKPVTAKLKGNAQPSKQQMAQMEGMAKKAGFKDFDEFGDVGSNIGMVFGGVDPQSKKYDPASLIQKEIAQVNADKKIPAKQKQQILKDLEAASKDVPALKFPANAELVAKNYDRLKPVME